MTNNRLGDLAVAAGDSAAAQRYQAGLAIAEKLAAADPGNPQYQRDLACMRAEYGNVS